MYLIPQWWRLDNSRDTCFLCDYSNFCNKAQRRGIDIVYHSKQPLNNSAIGTCIRLNHTRRNRPSLMCPVGLWNMFCKCMDSLLVGLFLCIGLVRYYILLPLTRIRTPALCILLANRTNLRPFHSTWVLSMKTIVSVRNCNL